MTVLQSVRRYAKRFRTRQHFRRAYNAYLKAPARQQTMDAQAALRAAFLASRGKCLEWATEQQRQVSPHARSRVSSELFPCLDDASIDRAVAALRRDGYFIVPERLSADFVATVREALADLPATARGGGGTDVQRPRTIAPRAATYWHDPHDLANVPELRRFMQDPALREICGRSLGCTPVLDMAAAWWSFPAAQADSASAQMYHYDLDRIRWLKVFVYLTDVSDKNGPHAFVRGSHATVHQFVTEDRRYEDAEVFRWYPQSDDIRFCAPAGTVFIEDTLGFHKGTPVQEGMRAVFECEFSINHFGYPYPEL